MAVASLALGTATLVLLVHSDRVDMAMPIAPAILLVAGAVAAGTAAARALKVTLQVLAVAVVAADMSIPHQQNPTTLLVVC